MSQKLRVYLDDERKMPADYDVHISTAEEAIALIEKGEVEYISLDNDLGEGKTEGKKVAQFIEHSFLENRLDFVDFDPHTSNPVAKDEILRCRKSIFKFIQDELKNGNEIPFQKMAKFYFPLIEKIILMHQNKIYTTRFSELFDAGVDALKKAVIHCNEDKFNRFLTWFVQQSIKEKLMN